LFQQVLLDWYHVLATPATMASLRTILPQVVLFAVFGIWIPLQKGIAFLDPVVLGAYASLGVVFAAPAVASGMPVLAAVRTGLAGSWATLIAGIGAVYATRPVPVGPNVISLAECGLFGLALSVAASMIVEFSLKLASATAAKVVARALLLALLGLFYFRSGWLPDVAWMGAAICAGIALIFWILLRRRA
jgi:hypothetical protein